MKFLFLLPLILLVCFFGIAFFVNAAMFKPYKKIKPPGGVPQNADGRAVPRRGDGKAVPGLSCRRSGRIYGGDIQKNDG